MSFFYQPQCHFPVLLRIREIWGVSGNMVADKAIEKLLSEGIGGLSFAYKGNFGRYIVVSLQRDIYKRELLLHLKSPFDKSEKLCYLTGFWYESSVKEADIVHVLFAEEKDDAFFLSDQQGIIVINPDFLLSGTSVVSGVFCRRKAVLSERFKGYEQGSEIMLIGSLVHQLFQEVVTRKLNSAEGINRLIEDLITQPQVLRDLFGLNMSVEKINQEIKKFIPMILEWVQRYLDLGRNGYVTTKEKMQTDKTNPKQDWNGQITNIQDIEENIWSPRFGIKGKIDLTVQTRTGVGGNEVLPLELKTGKASFSAEHRGQLTLYTMMMGDRRRPPNKGLLLYLRDGSMGEICVKEVEKRALIQLRNELVSFLAQKTSNGVGGDLSLPPLPEPLDSERACSKCPYLSTCSALQKVQENVPCLPHAMGNLVPAATEHLSQKALDYFRMWCLMLHLEKSSTHSDASVRALWCKDPLQRESSGSCLTNMTVLGNTEDLGTGHFINTLERDSGNCRSIAVSKDLPHVFQIGENVVISTANEIAISAGVVYSITTRILTLVLDRDLSVYRKHKTFYVDRCEYQNSMSTFFTNIAQLMDNSDRSRNLRSLLIDMETPKFSAGLEKNIVLNIKTILVDLNREQQRAVLRSLLARDYSILKGFPGTGKTSTIVGLVRILVATGHSVILTSYTHSAVDNILLKLKKHEDIQFVRLGKTSRIHKDILNYSESKLTKDMKTLGQIEEFYMNTKVVATTCLGMGHVVFRRRSFDFCIVDEASQVLEAACLGPLFFCSRFILVGDHLQLPPIVKSQSAKSLGMMTSLMERLDSDDATVTLMTQYRMNEPIMQVANQLVYDGKLQCATEQLKTSTLNVSVEIWSTYPMWIRSITSPDLAASVLFVDTLGLAPEMRDCNGHPVNPSEAEVIITLLMALQEMGVPPNEMGVITPYRAQVKLLKERISSMTTDEGGIEVNTVDQYQGRDKSVIIYSCVRAGLSKDDIKEGEILNDIRRLNVAVTRAKRKLIVLGHLQTLKYFHPFEKVLKAAFQHQIYTLKERGDDFSWNDFAGSGGSFTQAF